jgi:hypothetical protein
VIRGAGVGDGTGVGSGDGVGVGVWPNVSSGILVATIPAAPIAGKSFTNDRRPTRVVFFFFFIVLVGAIAKDD